MAFFKSYAVIYFSINAAICDVLQVSHTLSIFYCAARATFDRLSISIACRSRNLEDTHERVSFRDWLKRSFDWHIACINTTHMIRYGECLYSKLHQERVTCIKVVHISECLLFSPFVSLVLVRSSFLLVFFFFSLRCH